MRTSPLLVTLAALASTAAPAFAAPTHSTTIAARTVQAGRHAGPHIQPALKLAALPDNDAGVGWSFGLEDVP